MNNAPKLITAAEEFNISQDKLVEYLVEKGFNKDDLKPTTILTTEMYDALEGRFARDLPIRRLTHCLETKSIYLDIGRCDLHDEDFKEGSVYDKLLRQCTHIETLVLSNNVKSNNELKRNSFSRLPAALGFCKKLRKLNCSGEYNLSDAVWTINDFSVLSNLTDLTYLDVSRNKLTEIKGLESLTTLNTLNLSRNKLTEIKGLESLTALNWLKLSYNQLIEIKGLEPLTALQKLNLSENQLTEIKGLTSLTALNTLDLSYNQLTEIKGLESLTALKELDLSYNQLTEIKGLESLTALKELDLSENQLTEIKGLESLTVLNTLNLSYNHLTEIKGLESLTVLQELDLSYNQLTEIKGLESLTALNWLDLSYNHLIEIKGLESLTALKELDLSYIQLTEIKGLESLTALNWLYLSSNQLTEIKGLEFILNHPIEINLNLSGNPLIEKHYPNIEKNANHLSIVKELLLREKSKNKKSLTYPLKVLMLGNHGTGKSSLVDYFTGMKSEKSTHILRIANHSFTNSANKSAIPDIVFYDFGGQDFYHGLYQAFISTGALQIIVFDERKDKKLFSKDSKGFNITNYKREYWLGQKNYKEQGLQKPDPYIIVQTFADEADINEALPIDYTAYKGYKRSFFLSLSNAVLEEQNSNEAFFKAGKEYFKAYLECEATKLLKEHTSEEPEWYISFLEFILDKTGKNYKPTPLRNILKEYRADNINVAEKIESLQTNLSILHRHGLVLYYSTDELKDIVWLNPEALVKYIQEKVLSKSIITSQHPGIVSVKDFNKRTTAQVRQLLILQKVVFLHKPSITNPESDEYIIPNYLPLANDNDADYQLFTFGLGKPNFVIKFNDFIPFGFINQMICFYGQQPDAKKFWRNQLLFTLHNEARVLIQLDFEQLKIKVFFQLIMSSNTTVSLIAEYLFFNIMGLYWNIGNEILPSYEEFIDYKFNLNRPIENKSEKDIDRNAKYLSWTGLQSMEEYIPYDAYLSIDDERYISYKELFKINKEAYRIKSYSVKDERINKDDVKEIPVSPFSFVKETAIMKKVFISYAHNDVLFRQELQQFLVNLERDGLIEIWQDGLIQAGEDWNKKIKDGLEKADICILMLSQSFIVSNYVHETEFKTIMERRMNGSTLIVPVLIKECDWKNWKVYPQNVLNELNKEEEKNFKIASFQFLPLDDDNKRVKAINKWVHPEDAWLQIANAIRTFCKPN